MIVSGTCGNHLTYVYVIQYTYVNQIIMLSALNLYSEVYHLLLNNFLLLLNINFEK